MHDGLYASNKLSRDQLYEKLMKESRKLQTKLKNSNHYQPNVKLRNDYKNYQTNYVKKEKVNSTSLNMMIPYDLNDSESD